jgi:hypothetical protein
MLQQDQDQVVLIETEEVIEEAVVVFMVEVVVDIILIIEIKKIYISC